MLSYASSVPEQILPRIQLTWTSSFVCNSGNDLRFRGGDHSSPVAVLCGPFLFVCRKTSWTVLAGTYAQEFPGNSLIRSRAFYLGLADLVDQ